MLLTAACSVTVLNVTHCRVSVATVVTRSSQNSTFPYIAYFVTFMAILVTWFVLTCSKYVHHLSAVIKCFRLSRCSSSCGVFLFARMRCNQRDVRRNLIIFSYNKTLHVSDSSSVHHQEFFTVHTAMVRGGADTSLARPTSQCLGRNR